MQCGTKWCRCHECGTTTIRPPASDDQRTHMPQVARGARGIPPRQPGPQPECAGRLSQLIPHEIAARAITRTMASLSSQCDPGNAKAAACPRITTKGTARAARTASAALAALDLAAPLTQEAIPAAATSAMNPQENVTASILGSGAAPPRAISTTPCASHKAPPTSAAQAATLRRLITETTVPHSAATRKRRPSLRRE